MATREDTRWPLTKGAILGRSAGVSSSHDHENERGNSETLAPTDVR